MIERAQDGRISFVAVRCGWSRGRRSGGRLVRIQCPDRRILERAADLAERAGRGRRDREDRRRREVAGRVPSKMTRSNSSSIRGRAGNPPASRRRAGVGEVGEGRLEVRIARPTTRRMRREMTAGSPPMPDRRAPEVGRRPCRCASPATSADLERRRTSSGMSSMIASARVCGSIVRSRVSSSSPSP